MTGVQIFTEWLASFLEGFFYFAILHTLCPARFQKRKQAAVCLGISAVIAGGVLLLNMINITMTLMSTLYWIVVVMVGASILYEGTFAGYLFVGFCYLTGLILVDEAFSIGLSLVYGPEAFEQFFGGFSMRRVYLLLGDKGVGILLTVIICAVLKKLEVKLTATYRSALCSAIVFLCVSYWVFRTNETMQWNMGLLGNVLAVACILGSCTFYFYERFRKIQKEQDYTNLENELLKKNYQVAEESYESNARLYHDMNNHFLLIQDYLAEGNVAEAQRYLEKLGSERAEYSMERWTGVEAIDYILSQKVQRAKQNGIFTEIHAEYPKDCGIDPVDLCTILTNLLDNAIEACLKLPEVAERNISVTIRRIHQYIIIRITNSSTAAPDVQGGKLVTTKKDKQRHGWGMKSVRSAVEKYHGTMDFGYEDSVFTVSIMLFYK